MQKKPNPCKPDCSKHNAECHSLCTKYKEWRDAKDKDNKQINKQKKAERDYYAVCHQMQEETRCNEMICAWNECDKEFEPKDHRQKYCCELHARLAHNRRANEQQKRNRVKKVRFCEICGEKYYPGSGGKKTCSKECREKYYRKYYEETVKPKRDAEYFEQFKGHKNPKYDVPQTETEHRPLDGKVLHKAQMTVDEYNKLHGTNYSYGQYVHYVESKGV